MENSPGGIPPIDWEKTRAALKRRAAGKYGVRPRSVSNIVGEALLIFFRKRARPSGEPVRNAKQVFAYLGGILKWLVYGRRKRQPVFVPFGAGAESGAAPPPPAPGPTPSAAAVAADVKARIDEGIGELSPKHREVLLLHYREQLTYAAIGERLGEKEDTIRKRCDKAMVELKKILTKRYGNEFFEHG